MNNSTVFIMIALILFYYYYLYNSLRNDENKENFTIPVLNDWKDVSTLQCAQLKESIKVPLKLIEDNCNISDNLKERDAINANITCIDNTNRKIFNDREQRSWCASALGQSTDDIGFYSALSNEIMTNEYGLVPKQTEDVQNDEKTTQKNNNCNPFSDTNYSLITGKDFMPISDKIIYSVYNA